MTKEQPTKEEIQVRLLLKLLAEGKYEQIRKMQLDAEELKKDQDNDA